jgi:hypothetical protein
MPSLQGLIVSALFAACHAVRPYAEVSAVIAGLDDAYNTFDATDCCQVTVEVGDNDAPGLTVTPRDLSLTEGQNGTYIIQTRTQPLHTVYVNFTSSTPSLRVTAADGTAGRGGGGGGGDRTCTRPHASNASNPRNCYIFFCAVCRNHRSVVNPDP